MPTRDRAEEMLEAAASVLDQPVAHLELIVVDDASTDGTADALDRLCQRDRRVRAVRNPRALGPAMARNRGIEVAEGDVLATCDDDDRWLPGAAQTMLGFLDAHPELGAASSWHQVLHLGGHRPITYRGPVNYGEGSLLWANVVAMPFIFVRRAAFADDVRYDPALPPSEDWDLCIRCARERPMLSVPVACYEYRQHGGARVTGLKERHRRGRQRLVDKHGSRMSEACRLFHQAVMDSMDRPPVTVMRDLARQGAGSPALLAASALTGTFVASRVGVRRRDPGLPTRLLTRVVESGKSQRAGLGISSIE